MKSKNTSYPEVIYLDKYLLVINKPPGLLSLPDGYDPSKPHLREILEPEFGKLWIVHRLDKETSGVILLARNQIAHSQLNSQFLDRTIEKTYLCIVHGVPRWKTRIVNSSLRINVGRRKRSMVDPIGGKKSITQFKTLTRFDKHALIEACPRTGRTHQIRAHLFSIDHPILSDKLYGAGKITPFINRMALHAKKLKIIHPATQMEINFEADDFQDFKTAIEMISSNKNS
jgi:RluA family pseudouridine synthase